jgi:hypothetical protein
MAAFRPVLATRRLEASGSPLGLAMVGLPAVSSALPRCSEKTGLRSSVQNLGSIHARDLRWITVRAAAGAGDTHASSLPARVMRYAGATKGILRVG